MGTALNNTNVAADINFSLDKELIREFDGEYSRLAEILGIFRPEVVAAGTALYQLEIAGKPVDGTDAVGSSGTAYVEGDIVALSKMTVKKTPVGDVKLMPYRRLTTAQAIAKSGYEVAVMKTDKKLVSGIRAGILKQFFTFLGTGTGAATEAKTLQAALANVDAKLGDTLETNGDEGGRLIHFVNRQDAAAYLGTAPVTTQTAFGMTYLQNFLGITDVFLTSQVESGAVIATPVENIHVFTPDFGSLAKGGLSYTQSDSGLIGVAHAPAYDRVSTETNVLAGLMLFPEVKDYIVKGAIAPGV